MTPGPPTLPLTGGCMCGRVRFEVTEALLGAIYCHCKRCQRRTGTPCSVNAFTAPGSFRFVDGEQLVRSWGAPGAWIKSFCSECGSQIHSRHPENPALLSVRMGALDGDPGVRPSAHQFTDYAASWAPIPDDGLPRFPERLPVASLQPALLAAVRDASPVTGPAQSPRPRRRR